MVQYKHNYKAYGDLVMRSDGMLKALEQAGQDVQRRCGKGYVYRAKIGHTIALGMVMAVTEKANEDNSENNTLLKALY